MGARTRIVAFATGLLALSGTAARAASIVAEVDHSEVATDGQIVLTVTVEGTGGSEPVLPPLADFQVFSQGQSHQVQMINGSVTSSVAYNYVLVPKKPGTFQIAPITAEIGGQRMSSSPLTITVTAPGHIAGKGAKERDVYATATVSNDSPFVSELVIYTLRLLHRVQITNATAGEQTFPGLVSRDLGKWRDYETVIDGRRYAVNERKVALSAPQPGTITIEPATFSADVPMRGNKRRGSHFDDFFGDPFGDFFGSVATEKHVVRAPALELHVKPLPPAPTGFGGLVGQYTLRASLPKANLRVGESATLTVTIEGAGNTASMPDPEMDIPRGFKVYDDKPVTSVEDSEAGVRSKKILSRALVPAAVGRYVLTLAPLVYFDPKAGAYRSAQVEPVTVDVAAGQEPEQLHLVELAGPRTGKTAVHVLADDILPIYKRADAIVPRTLPVALMSLVVPAGLLPLLSFLSCWTYLGLQRNQGASLRRRRRRRALSQALAGLSSARRQRASGHAAEMAHKSLRGYFGDKLGLCAEALTRNDIVAQLGALHVPEPLVTTIAVHIDHLERAQYGAQTDSSIDPGALRPLAKVLKEIDKAIDIGQKAGPRA